MAEVSVTAEPEINPFSTLTGIVAFGILFAILYETYTHIGVIESALSKVEHPLTVLPASNTNTNQNPGTTSNTPSPTPATSGVAQGLVTISKVEYGVYGLIPQIAAIEGKLLADDSCRVGACDKVTANVTLVNNTTTDYDVTLYGYLIPAGKGEIPANSVGHFWSGNASGIVPGTRYQGIYPGKITAKSQITTENVSTAPLSVPNEKFGVLWQVYIAGQSSYTSQRFDPLRIFDDFTSTPSCQYG